MSEFQGGQAPNASCGKLAYGSLAYLLSSSDPRENVRETAVDFPYYFKSSSIPEAPRNAQTSCHPFRALKD